MKLIEDTRQQKNKHLNIHRYCESHNIEIVPKCLNVGDYMLENGNVSIDTKQDILELAQDLYQDRLVFNRKYRKSYRSGTKLIVLTEEYIKSVDELCRWQNSHTKIKGKFVYDMIRDVSKSYGVKFYFCDKKDTGKYLISLLQYYDKGG